MTVLTVMKDKQILVLGLGLTGMSCVRFLHHHGLSFAVNDSRDMPFVDQAQYDAFIDEYVKSNNSNDTGQVSLHTGQWHHELISSADIIIASPGIDLAKTGINQLVKSSCEIIGDVELFCQLNNEFSNPIKLLAVTGSNGKSTVVSLLAHLGKALGFSSELGGNIGQPVLDLLPKQSSLVGDHQINPAPEYLILELSSFQLETLKSMKAIAATVLNVSDDHLDRHESFSNYQRIKQSIYPQANFAVINRDDAATQVPVTENQPQQILSFGTNKPLVEHFGVGFVSDNFVSGYDEQNIDTQNSGQPYLMFGEQALIALDTLPLAGMHNAMNYLAAIALGYSAGWPINDMVAKLSGFKGLEHRCQRINTTDGLQWINDSKATNVGATLAAIEGLAPSLKLSDNKLIVIAGGEGKGADFTPLKPLLDKHVSQLITLGKDGDELAALVSNAKKVSSLADAVIAAKQAANHGDMILLSPACASIDMFSSFVERGNRFKALVTSLQASEVNNVCS